MTEDDGFDVRRELRNVWDDHVAWMDVHYGRRDPKCFWCRQRVVMSLQGFYSGGSWTTDRRREGPMNGGAPVQIRQPGDTRPFDPDADDGTTCPSSPDGAHDVIPGDEA